MSKKKNTDVIEPLIEVNDEETEVVETVEPKPEKPAKTIIGTVTEERLNVREEASKDSKVVTVVAKNSELQINTKKSTKDWYKVCTASGIEGFCMKEYVLLKQ